MRQGISMDIFCIQYVSNGGSGMKMQITYEWWNSDNAEITKMEKGNLIEDAMNHIHEMINDGYCAGQLSSEFDDKTFCGSWEVKEIEE